VLIIGFEPMTSVLPRQYTTSVLYQQLKWQGIRESNP